MSEPYLDPEFDDLVNDDRQGRFAPDTQRSIDEVVDLAKRTAEGIGAAWHSTETIKKLLERDWSARTSVARLDFLKMAMRQDGLPEPAWINVIQSQMRHRTKKEPTQKGDYYKTSARKLYYAAVKGAKHALKENQPRLFRDCLIVIFMINCPDRRRNVSGLTIHDIKGQLIQFLPKDTKNASFIKRDLWETTAQLLAIYLKSEREKLKIKGTNLFGLKPKSVTNAVGRRTFKLVGIRIPPHRIRDLAATSLVNHDPNTPMLATSVLGHADPRATKRYLESADCLVAARWAAGVLNGLDPL